MENINLSQELVELDNELYEIQKTLDDRRLSDDEAKKLKLRQSEIVNEIQAIDDTLKLHSVNIGEKSMYRRLF